MARRLFTFSLVTFVAIASASLAGASGGISSLTDTLIGGNCGATSTPFAPWGDVNSYYLTNDGDFGSGASGWTLAGGAAVVPGGAPFDLVGASHSSSLLIPSGGSATSPDDCFGLNTPGIRFFATSDESGTATIHVRAIANGLLGVLSVLDEGTATVRPGWAPTPVFSTTLSQLAMPLGAKSIQIEISSTGDVQVDDIYVDPFVSH